MGLEPSERPDNITRDKFPRYYKARYGDGHTGIGGHKINCCFDVADWQEAEAKRLADEAAEGSDEAAEVDDEAAGAEVAGERRRLTASERASRMRLKALLKLTTNATTD